MILAIASRKGGVGKTTLAINIARCLTKGDIIDCDVEKPNTHLFFHVTLKDNQSVHSLFPVVSEIKCSYCGDCEKFCFQHAFHIKPLEVRIDLERCTFCGGCQEICTQNAIEYTRIGIGEIEQGISSQLRLFQGITHIGCGDTQPILSQLTEFIDSDHPVIMDVPSTNLRTMKYVLQKADYVLLVTDSTPFGLYSLEKDVMLVKKTMIPFGVIINFYNPKDHRIELFCKKNKIPIHFKLPFNENIASLSAQAVAFVDKIPELKKELSNLIDKLTEEVMILNKSLS